MRDPETFLCNPVRSLQTMLRVLSEQDERYPKITPDGIYGPETIRAVTFFQRSHGLPVTGVTDQPTWEAIVSRFEDAVIEVIPARPLEIQINPNESMGMYAENPDIFILQAVLTVLALAYGVFHTLPATGIMDAATKDAISRFQQLSGLPMTGDCNKKTWNALAIHYPLAANIYRTRNLGQRSPPPGKRICRIIKFQKTKKWQRLK